jgi:hypothetical protein
VRNARKGPRLSTHSGETIVNIIIVLLIILLLFGGLGYHGEWHATYPAGYYGGVSLLGVLLVVLLALWLTGYL